MHVGRLAAVVMLVFCLAGCSGSDDAARNATSHDSATVALTPFATVRLKGRDTAYIGRTNAMAVASNGDVFVTDMYTRRVLRFDARGEFVEAIGRGGGGPNEFEGPAYLTVIDDSTLAVVDVLRRRVVLWDLTLKSARGWMALPGLTSPIVSARGVLYAAAPDLEHGTAGIRWRPPAHTPERLGTVLDVYREQFQAIWGQVAVAVSGDSLLYFGGKSDYLIVADTQWNPRDSLHFPRIRRRGIPREIDYTMGNGRNIYDVMAQVSNPFGLRLLPRGRFVAFHADASVLQNNSVVGRAYMTVLTTQGATRCVDVPIPARDTLFIPRMSFVAETLFVLDHFVDGDSAVAEVRKYHIGSGLC